MADIVYCYNDEVYFNLTNKCPCNCTFCIRNNGDSVGEAKTLWFDKEPTMEEIYKAIDAFDFSGYKEAVFCGYGEPTMALDKLIAVSEYMRSKYPAHLDRDGKPCPGIKLRLNTNGLGDLINKRSIAKEVCQAVDVVSISLNMPDAKSYNEVVRPAYGEKAFDAMLKFAQDCKKYTENVKFTVVDCIGEENVEKSRKVAEKARNSAESTGVYGGIKLREKDINADCFIKSIGALSTCALDLSMRFYKYMEKSAVVLF